MEDAASWVTDTGKVVPTIERTMEKHYLRDAPAFCSDVRRRRVNDGYDLGADGDGGYVGYPHRAPVGARQGGRGNGGEPIC